MTDELELLKEWDAEAAPLTDAARTRARFRLYTEMTAAPAPADGGTRRRQVLRIAAGTAVAAAVTGTAVVAGRGQGGGAPARAGGGPGTGAPRLQNVSAATVLRGAATHERRRERPVAPRDDQFIYTREIIKETEKKTGATKSYVDENWRSVDGSRRSWVMEIGHGWWAPPLKKNESMWPPQDWTELRRLPTDPEKLLLAAGSFGHSRHASVRDIPDDAWWTIHFALAGLLKLVPVMPEGLRPAAYEALALVPGVKTVPGVRDAKGRLGVAVTYNGRPPGLSKGQRAPSYGSYFIFDPTTYAFLGFRDERTADDGAKTYIQLSYLDDWAVVDRAKQRP